jgi:enterochelin esterase-like enzyme
VNLFLNLGIRKAKNGSNMAKSTTKLIAIILFAMLGACSTPAAQPCNQPGTTVDDRVPFPDSGEDHPIEVHLPPCYAEHGRTAYPVVYWTNGYGQLLFDTAERLAAQGDVPPSIFVMIDIDPNKGAGADGRILNYVVPYVDSHYRTRADASHRSITGISNGAAIAIRAAFQPPNLFGRVAVLSGGIADGEQAKFTAWVQAMNADRRPAVLIDVGEQDGILLLTHYLTDLLDQLQYPYTFTHAPGDHTGSYWDSHLEEYLKWLLPVQ